MKIRRKHLLPSYFLVSRLWNQSIPKLFVLLLLLGFLVIVIEIGQELSDCFEDRISRDCHNHPQNAMDIAGQEQEYHNGNRIDLHHTVNNTGIKEDYC